MGLMGLLGVVGERVAGWWELKFGKYSIFLVLCKVLVEENKPQTMKGAYDPDAHK